MSTYRSVDTKCWIKFLTQQGLSLKRISASHHQYGKEGLLRAIPVYEHKKEIPASHINAGLKTLGISKELFVNWLKINCWNLYYTSSFHFEALNQTAKSPESALDNLDAAWAVTYLLNPFVMLCIILEWSVGLFRLMICWSISSVSFVMGSDRHIKQAHSIELSADYNYLLLCPAAWAIRARMQI